MDMRGQPQLWTPAVEAMVIQLRYEWPEGWQVLVNSRRQGEGWEDRPGESYDCLATGETLDVVCAVLANALGL